MARRPMFEKDERYKRTVKDTTSERDSGHGRLFDFKNRNQVHLFWDFSDQATEDGMLLIRINGEEAVVDAQQVMRFARWV